MSTSRTMNLRLMCLLLAAMAGCERHVAADEALSNEERLKKALPGAKIGTFDPAQLKNLGPSAVPGVIPQRALSELRLKALAGDRHASQQLLEHYVLAGNHPESRAWARIGAENGEYNSMIQMYAEIAEQPGVESCVRAIYWLTRARTYLAGDLATLESAADRGLTQMLMGSADKDIAKSKEKTAGC